jgi:hypothetical protein
MKRATATPEESDELTARRDDEIMRQLDELFADTELAKEQAIATGNWDEIGTDWNAERW